jgi:hypothetical protein
MTNYLIYNEDGELMRIVGRQEEARAMCCLRLGWTFKARKSPKLSGYREAVTIGDALI